MKDMISKNFILFNYKFFCAFYPQFKSPLSKLYLEIYRIKAYGMCSKTIKNLSWNYKVKVYTMYHIRRN